MKYDLAIIGAGPAGMTAGIFASRAGLKTICFEQMAVGGNIGLAYKVENYPGFKSISGYNLATKMERQAKLSGLEFSYEGVKSLNKSRDKFTIETKRNVYEATKVIIASGGRTKRLSLPNEEKFVGKGVSYCASCDGNFYKGKTVAVVGGGYTALGDVLYLSSIAKKVYLINRSDKFRFPVAKLEGLSNVEMVINSTVKKLNGEQKLESIVINSGGEIQTIRTSALFIAIGQEPNLDFLKFELDLDSKGYIKVKKDQSTNVKNLYACGDVTDFEFKQIVTACASGAVAANACIEG